MNFYSILKHFHSGWAYLVITMGLVLFFAMLYYKLTKKENNGTLKRISLFTTMIFHIQLLAGVLLYILSPYVKWNENTMSDAISRLYSLEHPLMMFSAVLFITIANSKNKKSTEVKFPTLILVILAMACVFAMIPWHVWPS